MLGGRRRVGAHRRGGAAACASRLAATTRLPPLLPSAPTTTHRPRSSFLPPSYEFLNLDDGWSELAREGGRLVGNRAKFPSGIRALSTYVHGKGLKFGIYADSGALTCAGYPGAARRVLWWPAQARRYDCGTPDALPCTPPALLCRLPRL